jgi:hypothetical protein
MKISPTIFLVTLSATAIVSCAGPKEQACTEFEQAKRNAEATVSLATQLKVEGKLTTQELLKVDQDAALYSKRLRDLCVFLQSSKISYSEYDNGVAKANQDYQKLRELVNSAQNKP